MIKYKITYVHSYFKELDKVQPKAPQIAKPIINVHKFDIFMPLGDHYMKNKLLMCHEK